MSSEEKKKLEDKLWFTYKARIRAEERLRGNDFHSQLILVLYALVSAILSVIVIRYPSILGKNTELVSACLGIALLVISLLVTNRDFRGRALAMKQNYLDIQSLFNELTLRDSPARPLPEIAESYQKILAESENHSETDYKYFRVFQKTNKPASKQEILGVYFYIVRRFLILAVIYLLPFLTLMILAV